MDTLRVNFFKAGLKILFFFAVCVPFCSGLGNMDEPAEEAAGDESFVGSDREVYVFAQTGHSHLIQSATFSPDGKKIISGSQDRTAKIWDVESGKEIWTINGHSGPVNSAIFSPDGKTIATCSADKTIKLWDVETGKKIKTFFGSNSGVTSIAFNSNGKFLVSTTGDHYSNDCTVRLWDAETGNELKKFSGHSKWVYQAVFSFDEKQLISCSEDKTIIIWDIETGNEIQTLTGHSDSVCAIAKSPDGKLLASGSGDKTIILWDLETGQAIKNLTGHTKTVYALEFSPDGNLISCGFDGIIKIWDVNKGTEIKTLSREFNHGTANFLDSRNVYTVNISPDGRTVCSGDDTEIVLWDKESGFEIKTLGGLASNWIRSAAFNTKGDFFVTGSEDGVINLWDIKASTLVKSFSGQTRAIYSVAFSPDGKKIASSSFDRSVIVRDIQNADQEYFLQEAETENDLDSLDALIKSPFVTSLSFSPDGMLLAGALSNKTSKIWDVQTGKLLKVINEEGSVNTVVFSADGKTLISGSDDETIKIRNTKTWETVKILKGYSSSLNFDTGVNAVSVSPDGRFIAGGSSTGTALIWDGLTYRELRSLVGHSNSINSLDFNKDGTLLLTASSDKTIRIWTTSLAVETLKISGHQNWVYKAEFSPNENFILSCSQDSTARIWNAETGEEIAQFISFADGEWIVIAPDGYYNASLRGDEYLNVRIGNEVFGIDQFSKAFYHPEVVEARLQGLPDPSIVAERGDIRKATAPPALKVAVINKAASGSALLDVSVFDKFNVINDIEVFVNGRLVGGAELQAVTGTDIQPEPTRLAIVGEKKELDVQIPIFLDPGSNLIEVIASNANDFGIKTLYLSNSTTKQTQKSELWLLAIGVNDYENFPFRENSGGLWDDLKHAAGDAEKMGRTLGAQEGKHFSKVHTLLISDTQPVKPTRQNILANMNYLQQAGPNDLSVLFVAAHGKTENGIYYFFPKDIAANEAIDYSGAISIDAILNALDIPGRKLVFLDTCESGGVDNNKLVRSLKNRSTVIFSASKTSEYALENTLLGGIFTNSLVAGMSGGAANNGLVTINSLSDFVLERVKRLSRDRQHPERLIPPGYRDFVVTETE